MSQPKLKRLAIVSLFSLGAILLAANLLFQSIFAGRALPGTNFAGTNMTGKTFAGVQSLVSIIAQDQPSLSLNLNGRNIVLQPSDIAMRPDASRLAEELTAPPQQNWLPLLALIHRPATATLGYTADQQKLDQVLANIITGIGQPATNATISITAGQISIVPGKPGVGVELASASKSVDEALSVGASAVTLNTQPIAPAITPDDLQPIIKQLQSRLSQPIILTYQGKSFKPTPAVVGSWLGVAETANGPQIAVNSDQIKAYLNQVGKTVNVAAKNQVINTVNGAVQSTQAGANGLQIDQTSLTAQIRGAILAAQPLSAEIPTQVVAFKTVYNKTYNLDYGKYIEVNLSMQHLWVYQDHQVVMDTPITSGSTGTGHPTVQGLFAVYTKERDRWLDGRPLGYNYDVFVQYWMPFYADYGLHDASWRKSFGGQDYYYGGSHGCVNMPIPAAAWLYGWVDVGTPVWVHS